MKRYEKGQIYQICDIGYTVFYIGSTCQTLSKRFSIHKKKYCEYKKGKPDCDRRVNQIFDQFGIENCKIEHIEHFPCESKSELLKREGHYIRNTDCVNKIVSGRTGKEYRKDNEEKCRQNKQNYWNDNHEYLLYQKQIYRQLNPDVIKRNSKEYWQKKKDILLEKKQCGCGKSFSFQHKRRHEKSQYHQNWLKQQEPEEEAEPVEQLD